MAITVAQVLATALDNAQLDQSTGFLSKARLYYNLSIVKLGNETDWPFYNKLYADQNFIAGQFAYNLPADYSKSDSVYLINQGQRAGQILIQDAFKFDALSSPSNNAGIANICMIDQDQSKIIFDQAPSQGLTNYQWRLRYFRKPIQIDLSGADDSDAPDCPDPNVLIDAITARFFKWTADDRYGAQKAEAEQTKSNMEQNSWDTNANSMINLAASVFKAGRRQGRGGGF